MNIRKLIKAIIFTGTVLILCGCRPPAQTSDGRNHSEQFLPEEQPTAEGQLLQAQIVRGAGGDATLYAMHFTGADLNSLGRAKLDLMLCDSGAGTLAVWMAIPDDEQASARRMSVAAYLKDHGIFPEQIAFGRGANPGIGNSSAKGLKDLASLDGSAASAPAASV